MTFKKYYEKYTGTTIKNIPLKALRNVPSHCLQLMSKKDSRKDEKIIY